MGMTISEKILAKASGRDAVHADEIVWVNIDKAMMDDILGPRVEIADNLKKMNAKVWDPDKVVIVSDHYTPPANIKQANIVKFTRDWAAENGVKNYYEFAGPCHQVMVDKGHVLPGTVVVGTDSHTTTYGAFTCFSTGIGSTEMSGVLATGQTWMKVPQTIRINWNGKLQKGIMAKDVSLHTIKPLGHAGATYKAMEYAGDTISSMIMDERMCLSNMAVEAGAKVGMIGFDQVTAEFMKKRFGITGAFEMFNSDEDAVFSKVLDFRAEDLVPQVACPHEVDNVFDVTEAGQVPVNQVYIGSCTGGRYNDLKMAAELLKGKQVNSRIRVLVSPASKDIYNECLNDGILAMLAAAGCRGASGLQTE
ncbi:MAG: 3-isopropylmalate dehydratase large subunit, partial [Oscillospiraceae bacterium]|nr:3-isopropylmalate dehydratase large subunit [Oscillospiraceae bacterium]